MASPYDDPQYKRNRARILADRPPCSYCPAPATEADHVVPVFEGGGNEIGNLVPACRACNARRGQRDKARAIRARTGARKARLEALAGAGVVSLDDRRRATNANPPSPNPFLPGTQTTPSAYPVSLSENGESARTGRETPRLETVYDRSGGNLADAIAGFAETHLGVSLMAWQRIAAEGLTAFRADGSGKFAHKTGLVSTARQNGKTTLLAALIGAFLTSEPARRGHPLTVLSVAHTLGTATEVFYRLAPVLETAYGAKTMKSYGRSEVRLPDGSRWLIRAANPSAGHGLSADLVIADEIFAISGEALDHGLRPTMRARPNPLLALFSTAGTEASSVFIKYREQGLRAIDTGQAGSFYFAEWSPPPDLDPMSPDAWTYANPALGTTLEFETLVAEAEAPDRAAFLRASVNLWISTLSGWIAPGLWPQLELADDEALPPGGVIAVETSFDEARYFATRAVPLDDGRIAVTVAFYAESLGECSRAIEQAAAADPRVMFAVSPTIDLGFPRSLEARKTVVGYTELLRYTPAVQAAIRERRVAHTGEEMLAEHVNRAVAVRSQGSLALSSQKSPGPIELARCAVWSVAIAGSATRKAGRPIVARSVR